MGNFGCSGTLGCMGCEMVIENQGKGYLLYCVVCGFNFVFDVTFGFYLDDKINNTKRVY